MPALVLPIILQMLGVLVLIAEVIIPSGGVLSVVTVGLFGYSLYLVFTEVSRFAGMMFVAADLIMLPFVFFVGVKLLARSPAALKTALSKTDGYSSQSEDLAEYMGRTGTVITDLRPAGMAMIDNHRVDVVSRGEYIEKGSKVIVLAVEGNRILVKEIKNNPKNRGE